MTNNHIPEVDPWKLLDEAQEVQRVAEAAIRRVRVVLSNMVELRILPPNYHREARTIIAELTAALVKMGTEKAI